MFADIILPLNLPQMLTYGVPHEMQDALRPGMRVEVALGKNKQYAGIVERLHKDKPQLYQVRPIKAIIDEEPVVNEKQLKFWHWIAQYYMSTPGEVMQAALPAHLKLMGETRLEWKGEDGQLFEWSDEAYLAAEALQMRKELTITELRGIVSTRHFAAVLNELLEQDVIRINDSLEPSYRPRREKVVTLSRAYKDEAALIDLFNQLERAPKQLQLLMAYTELSIKHGIVKQNDLLERASASSAAVKALADKGIFIIEEVDVDRVLRAAVTEVKQIILTPEQQAAYDELNAGLTEKNVALLHGVTGSGKTLLYIQKIKECLASG
jgi:primosomal protein N' (replication factor Y)